jgi:tetratricopeptide (TPR) repeat protein
MIPRRYFSSVALISCLLLFPAFSGCSSLQALQNNNVTEDSKKLKQNGAGSNYTGVTATVDAIAQQVTVLINSQKSGNGSGAIVAKQEDIYYVLTANHVVAQPDSYEIVTPDGQKYPIDAQNIKSFDGVDLALVSFKSSQTYQVATLGDYELGLEDRPLVFISGFPGKATQDKKAITRKMTAGIVYSPEIAQFQAQNAYSLTNGYELVYSNLSQRGMSGGPVLDSLGRVIGINTASEGEITVSDEGQEIEMHLGNSLGVPISTFLGLAPQAQLDVNLLQTEKNSAPPLSEAEIETVSQNLAAEAAPSEGASAVDWLNYGNQLWRIKKRSEAVIAFDRAIQLEPNLYQAYYAKAVALYGQDKFPETLAAIDRAIQLSPDVYEFWRMKAETLEGMKKWTEALTSIDKALQLNPSDTVLYLRRGFILFNAKRFADAETNYSKAIALNPKSYYAYFFRGLSRFNLKKYPDAIEDFSKSVELQPNHYSSYTTRGSIYTLMGNTTAAMSDLNKAISIAPDSNPLKLEAYKARGMLYLGTGDAQSAIADCTKVIDGNPENKRLLREGYECLAQASATSGNLQQAIDYQGKAIAVEPNNAVAYRYRGGFRNQAQDFQGALEDLNKAIQLDPNDADAYSYRATARASLNDMQGAMADTQKAEGLYTQKIAQDPDNMQLYINRAIARVGMGNKQGALQDAEKAEQLMKKQGITSGAGYNLVQKIKNYLQSGSLK